VCWGLFEVIISSRDCHRDSDKKEDRLEVKWQYAHAWGLAAQ
jgi:hypothetical protein